MKRLRRVCGPACAAILLVLAGSVGAAEARGIARDAWNSPRLPSLEVLSTPALRERAYGSRLTILERLGSRAGESAYSRHYQALGTAPYDSFIAGYDSDGSRVYTRIDLPSGPAPDGGFPVLVFLHGWYSNEDAPAFDFSYQPGTPYADLINSYVEAGYLVAYPGWRGYGTVQGRAADGMSFSAAWNNRSYLMPVFFAIDVLNLLDSLDSIRSIDWRAWDVPAEFDVAIDPRRIYLAGHSQGGDVLLTALAVAGEGSSLRARVAAASIWAGCFASRFEQLEMYVPMSSTPQAFVSGDGSWNGSATGADGSRNAELRFPWPPDWIGTVDTSTWTWQRDSWPLASVAEALAQGYGQMYAALNDGVANLGDAVFTLNQNEHGRTVAVHDARVAEAMARIGAYAFPQYLQEPLNLHYSDRDYYSPPAWNESLARRVNAAGGAVATFEYPGNTHGLQRSKAEWFSPPGTQPGFALMLERDRSLFASRAPRAAQTRKPPQE